MSPERWVQIKDVFTAALECPSEERPHFLNKSCNGDPELRQEVEYLLTSYGQRNDFLEHSPAVIEQISQKLEASHHMLAAGQRVAGRFLINRLIGRGGMGEVYEAHDELLQRTVALKALSLHGSKWPDAKKRIEREARAISRLNHPNICVLYDMAFEDDTVFLIMEYLEGETLDSRLAAGSLTMPQILSCGAGMANALDYAHRHGIVHRDLKPSNVMLTRSGVKLLDFGVALFVATQPGRSLREKTLKESLLLTSEGLIIGTLQYMSPEQRAGKQADGRTDVFNMGLLLYEMATAKKAMDERGGLTDLATLSETSTLDAHDASRLSRVIKRCLSAAPDDRWQTAGDLQYALELLVPDEQRPFSPSPPVHTRRDAVIWASIALAAVIGLVISLLWPRSITTPEAIRFVYTPPKGITCCFLESDGPAVISPDGRQLAFAGTGADGKRMLFVRRMNSTDADPVPGTDGAAHPFWAPDSQAIGFFTDKKLKRVTLGRELPHTVCDVTQGRGGTWSSNGLIVFTPSYSDGLYSVPSTGGSLRSISRLDRSRQENSHRWPHFLPDGRHFMYFVRSARPDVRGVYIGSLDSHVSRRLLNSDSGALYAPAWGNLPAHVLFVRNSRLMAQAFDTRQLEVMGDAFPLAESFDFNADTSCSPMSVSSNGVLTYSFSQPPSPQLSWYDKSGKLLEQMSDAIGLRYFRLAPSGSSVVVERLNLLAGTSSVWLLEPARSVFSRITSGHDSNYAPIWSPDEKRIAFTSDRDSSLDLYERTLEGSDRDTPLLRSDQIKVPTDWSSDGAFLLYDSRDPKTGWDIWVLALNNSSKPSPVLQTEFDERQAQFSPDTKWIAYVSNETGSNEIYVRRVAPPTGKWQISTQGGSQPRWSLSGRELFYVSTNHKLMSVEVSLTPLFRTTVPRTIMALPAPSPGGVVAGYEFDLARDGKRILVRDMAVKATPASLTVVVNWPSQLRR
jgi:serine/threonine protein kinase